MLTACHQPATYRPQVSAEEIRAEEASQQALIDEAARTGGAPRPWRNRPNMQKQFESVAERIESAAAKLCQEMGLPEKNRRCYFYFDTSRSLDINASADGKYIVFTRGMLRFLESDDEIAFFMGHEMAHNMMGHLEAQSENVMAGYFIGAMLDAAVVSQGGYSGGWKDTGAVAGKLSYSQSFEAESDYIGLYIAARAGYNIRKAPGVWRRLSLEDPDGVYNAVTHPSNAERFVAMQKAIDEIEYKRKHRLPLVPEMSQDFMRGDYKAERKPWLN